MDAKKGVSFHLGPLLGLKAKQPVLEVHFRHLKNMWACSRQLYHPLPWRNMSTCVCVRVHYLSMVDIGLEEWFGLKGKA